MTRDEVEEKIKNAENAIIEISKDLPDDFIKDLKQFLDKWITPRNEKLSDELCKIIIDKCYDNGIR